MRRTFGWAEKLEAGNPKLERRTQVNVRRHFTR
jgi:hypothetical protein